MYGDETDNWMGRQVQLYTTKVKAFGAVHDAIRIRSAGTVSAAPVPEQDADLDDIMEYDDDPVPESLADAGDDTAADYVLTQPPKGDPPVFSSMKDGLEWAVKFGAFSNVTEAKREYMALKATKSNAEWDQQKNLWRTTWIEYCTIMAGQELAA